MKVNKPFYEPLLETPETEKESQSSQTPKCAVPFCPNPEESYEFFPVDKVQKQSWLKAIFGGKFVSKFVSSQVCHKHFSEDDFEYVGQHKILKPNARPTKNLVNLEAEEQAKRPSRASKTNANSFLKQVTKSSRYVNEDEDDHDYTIPLSSKKVQCCSKQKE